MFRKLFILFSFLFLRIFSVVCAESDFFNFAYIPNSTYLNFNWQIDGKVYEVNLDTANLQYIKWNDSRYYYCLPVYWTGYTDTLGEIYFGYEGNNTYICADGKWRWYAKISIWWWINFEDNDLGDWENWSWAVVNIWKDGSDTEFYYNWADFFWNWTWSSYTQGLGFWVWNYVKTQSQPRLTVFDKIDLSKSYVSISSWVNADWLNDASFSLVLKDGTGNAINWLFLNEISFYTWTSFWRNDWVKYQSWLMFTWARSSLSWISLDSWEIFTWVYSLLPWEGEFGVVIGYEDRQILFTWNTRFNFPFILDFTLSSASWRLLIWESQTGNIIVNWPSNIYWLTWYWEMQLTWNLAYTYSIMAWKYRNWLDNFVVNVSPDDYFIDNSIETFYSISWTYKAILSSKEFNNIPFSNLLTNRQKIYADKKINNIELIQWCYNIVADWKSLCNLSYRFKNNKAQFIPYLSFDLSVDDENKSSSDKSKTFDIDETDWSYTPWLFLNSSTNAMSSSSWFVLVDLYSYKPVINWDISISFDNFQKATDDIYDWWILNSDTWINLSSVNFTHAVDLSFDWMWDDNWISLGQDNILSLVFQSLVSNTSLPEYNIVWTISWCSDCSFVWPNSFGSNAFWIKTININITGSDSFDAVVFDTDYYKYKLVWWRAWDKIITLKPNLYLNAMTIPWQFFSTAVKWLTNRWVNLDIVQEYDVNASIIGSNMPFSSYMNTLKSSLYSKIRWITINNLSTDHIFTSFDNLGTKVYKCNDWVKIIVQDTVDSQVSINGTNEIILMNCPLHIFTDIVKNSSTASLKFISIKDSTDNLNYDNTNGWIIKSNIYIYPQVDTIFAHFFTDGSILFSNADTLGFDTVFIERRWDNPDLKRQIYIRWRIMSRNVFWWWFVKDDKVVLPLWKTVAKDDTSIFFIWVNAEDIAQAYDLNFWRATLVGNNGLYNTDALSDYIKDNYSCDGNVLTSDPICIKSVVLEYEQ